MGARPMRRLIQREIEDPLSILLLENSEFADEKKSRTVVLDHTGDKLSLKIKKSKSKIVKQQEELLV